MFVLLLITSRFYWSITPKDQMTHDTIHWNNTNGQTPPHVYVYFRKRNFASRPDEYAVSGYPKQRFWKRSSDCRFFSTEALSCSCGRSKTEVFEYDDIRGLWHQRKRMRAHAGKVEVDVFESFSRIRVDGQIWFEDGKCGSRLFHIHLRVWKYPDTCDVGRASMSLTKVFWRKWI